MRDRVQLDAVEHERLGRVVDVAGPADPHAAGVPQHRQQGTHEPAGARRPPVVVAHHRQPVGGDDDRGRLVGSGNVDASGPVVPA